MPWIDFNSDDNRTWQVNQEGLYLMARGSKRASLARQYTDQNRSGEGWFDGPVMVEVVTDWGRVNRETDAASSQLYDSLARKVITHPEDAARNFIQIVAGTRINQDYIRGLQRDGMRNNMQAVERHVSNWEHGLAATRFVRDTSWTVLILLSAIPTGGASAAAGGTGLAATATSQAFGLTMGSLGRGNAVYQDTGNVGAAVINGAGSFITGAIGLPPGGGAVLTRGGQALILGIQSASAGGFTAFQSLAEGNSAETAGWQAVSAAGFNFAGGRLSGSNTFSGLSLPVQVSVQLGAENLGNMANSAIEDSDTSSAPAAPLARGSLTHAGVPVHTSSDADYIRSNILRPKP